MHVIENNPPQRCGIVSRPPPCHLSDQVATGPLNEHFRESGVSRASRTACRRKREVHLLGQNACSRVPTKKSRGFPSSRPVPRYGSSGRCRSTIVAPTSVTDDGAAQMLRLVGIGSDIPDEPAQQQRSETSVCEAKDLNGSGAKIRNSRPTRSAAGVGTRRTHHALLHTVFVVQ